MTFSEAYNKCMPLSKRKKEQSNIWVAWVIRPLSVLLTLPFINTRIQPSHITQLSILFSIAGFVLLVIPSGGPWLGIIGWFCFFVWAILDGVDGNLARCKNACSKIGELWDAVGGYAALVLIFMGAGIHASFDQNIIGFGSPNIILIIAGFSSIMALFPRLIMHKMMSINPNSKEKSINDKANFSLKEIIVMNLISASGFFQVIFLLCIIFHLLNIFTYFYCFVNFAIMLISLRKLLK